MNYFELYPGDYLRDTTRLTLLEHGAYLRLLIAYYGDEQPLPGKDAELFTIAGAVTAADKEAVRKVAAKFFPVCSDGLRRKNRVEEEIAKARRRIEAAQSNGGKGGRPKKDKIETQEKPNGFYSGSDLDNPDGKLNLTKKKALHTPDPNISVGRSEASAEISTAPTTDAGRACQLLRQAGCVRVNPSNPNLLTGLAEGITPESLRDTYLEFPDVQNPFAYAIATARSRHAEGARAISTGPPAAMRPMQISKTGMAVQALEAMKSENRLGNGRDLDGPAEAHLPQPG